MVVTLPLHISVPDGHQVVALPETGDHGEAALFHPHQHYRSVPSHAEPKTLRSVLSQLDVSGSSPVVLGRENSLWPKLLEKVTHSVSREVWEGQSELDGGGWKNWWRLQQLLEVVLLVDLLVELQRLLVALFENLLQGVLLPQLSAHPVHPEGLLMS